MTDHDALRAKIAALKNMDLAAMHRRAALFSVFTDIEAGTNALAVELDVDNDLVLLVLHAVWSGYVNASAFDGEAPTPEVLTSLIVERVRVIINALAEGVTHLDDVAVDQPLQRVIDLGRRGVRITPTREALTAVTNALISSGADVRR